MRCRVFRRNSLACLALILGLPFGAARAEGLLTRMGQGSVISQQSGGLSVRRFRDWQVACDARGGQRSCRVSTEVRGDTDAGPLSVGLSVDVAGQDAPVFTVLTPLDLLVAKGVELRVDNGAPLRLAYRSCHAQGCLVPFLLDGGMADRFRRGVTLRLSLFALDGTPLELEGSLLGFTAAMDAAR